MFWIVLYKNMATMYFDVNVVSIKNAFLVSLMKHILVGVSLGCYTCKENLIILIIRYLL